MLEAAHTLGELAAMSEAELASVVIPVENLFANAPEVILPPFFGRLARSGQHIYLKKIGQTYPLGAKIRLKDENGFFALGEVREFPDEKGDGGKVAAIKPIKMFLAG